MKDNQNKQAQRRSRAANEPSTHVRCISFATTTVALRPCAPLGVAPSWRPQQFVLQTAQAGVKLGFSLVAAWCGLGVGGGLRLAPKEGRHAGRLRGESVRGRRIARQPRLLSLLE
eukprot:scaffold5722_cov69-Phaeocystis_antarctica.AAC.1